MTGLGLDDLFRELRYHKWTLWLFGRRDAPNLYAATLQWNTCTDVLIIRSEERATAYRTPRFPNADPFRPTVVAWQYGADALWALRAVLTIGAPGRADAPRQVLVPAPDAQVPLELGWPVTIRPTGLVQDPTPKTVW
ncbi:hypothetical protein G3I59_32740 [Amycolatopsis rubida]|uniref:Uncharacterized protein n=1 Tax=Amycolatopsis rubida TaxID=112413 RepID=A0ABX0C211_9PSEU|nr:MULTISPECIES: hypothetical protein [Amycolatopsis]MYW95240.1 hypothetical protein [Amycolatopsis rubida]NEC60228.1 hypothetical protein [Amycolatopsis rubida]OAP28362.1 hypothetical protein A4R44_00149 [Amycolatopsis sp. M39]